MVKDTAPPYRYGPGYDSVLGRYGQITKNDGSSSSLSRWGNETVRTQRATVADDSVARQLLNATKKPRYKEVGLDELVNLEEGSKFVVLPKEDKRPLLDRFHEATITNGIGIQWIKDTYALRGLIRKAHCFTLDDATSRMVAEFSVAITYDLEAARRLAIPPFPVTWIDFNNVARLDRIKELGGKLTDTAAGNVDGPPVDRCGWLIYPADIGGYYAFYVTSVNQGVLMAPLAYYWHTDEPVPRHLERDETVKLIEQMTLGVDGSGVGAADAYTSTTPLHSELVLDRRGNYINQVHDLMIELSGELRHIWGLLIAISSSEFGVRMDTSPQAKHTDIRQMPNGKPLLPIEHKVLHLHLNRKATAQTVVVKAVTRHHTRWHEVRGHWRTLRNEDGSVRKRVEVHSHARGDKKLGVITKTYKVEK